MVVKILIATEADARNRLLRSDVKKFLRQVRVPYARAFEWLNEGAELSDCELIDREGNKVEIAEFSDADIDSFDYWYRDWIKTPEIAPEPRLRVESTDRIVLLMTMLRMIFPKESATWGKPMMVVRARLAA